MSLSDANATDWRGTDQGTKLKSTSGWNSDGNGTNESGFSALPSGFREFDDGLFYFERFSATFWAVTATGSLSAWSHSVSSNNSGVARGHSDKRSGRSVRCVRD